MRKLFLLLAVGASFTAGAQQKAYSVVHSVENNRASAPQIKSTDGLMERRIQMAEAARANKSTDQINGEWFSYVDGQFVTGISVLRSTPLYGDSTLLIVPTNVADTFHWWQHGIGTSFDPTSPVFDQNDQWGNTSIPAPSFLVNDQNSYVVDSIRIMGFYNRNNPQYTDTLFVDVASVDDQTPNTYRLFYGPDPFFTDSLNSPDGKLNVAYPTYDWNKNRISDSVTGVRRMTKILDAAAFADTTAEGWNVFSFPLNNLPVDSFEGRVASLVTFKSGFQYPFSTNLIDNANSWWMAVAELRGTSSYPKIYQDDYNNGLLARTNERYQVDNPQKFQGHALPISTYLFLRGFTAETPVIDYHVKCISCFPTSVSNVNANTLSELNAYPNPANTQINITFSVAKAGKVNISVANAVGQVVDAQSVNVSGKGKASFSTSNLANGVYFYTVESNGNKSTQRFVVAH